MKYGRLYKKQKQCLPNELEVGDCWSGVSLANTSGLILAARGGKHTDKLPIGVSGHYRGKNRLPALESAMIGAATNGCCPGNIAHHRQG